MEQKNLEIDNSPRQKLEISPSPIPPNHCAIISGKNLLFDPHANVDEHLGHFPSRVPWAGVLTCLISSLAKCRCNRTYFTGLLRGEMGE